MSDRTFGPAFEGRIDRARIVKQHEEIRSWMLVRNWHTLNEIESALGFPQSSISAQLRHLRKKQFGGYLVDKRRRVERGFVTGTWEYRVRINDAVDQQTELKLKAA
jgi:hypothetical protein